LPTKQAEELLLHISGGSSDIKGITIYEEADEYKQCLIDATLCIKDMLNITLDTNELVVAFPKTVDRAIGKWASGAVSLRGWRAVHLSEIIVDILRVQAAVSRDVRDAALRTLDH
jgi:hypothetical protein